MKRLDRYLLREMIVPFLIGQGAVVFMLLGTVLYNNADAFLNYQIPAIGVARIALYFLPYLINLTMPVAVAIAASLTVSRLTRDTEITVLRAAGISLKRIFLPIFLVGLLLSGADFYFGEKVVPLASQRFEQTMSDISKSIKFLVPQERQVVQSPDKRITAYIGRMQFLTADDPTASPDVKNATGNHARLYNVMLLITDPAGNTPKTILADTAEYDNGVWHMADARVHTYQKNGLDETFARGNVTIDLRLSEKTFNLIPLQLPLYSASATTTFRQLGEQIARDRQFGFLRTQDVLDYHFKLSVPFSCLVFALVCPPLALRFARAGSFMGVLLSIILVFVYWNTLLAAKILGAKFPNVLPPVVAAWGQNAIFSLIGLFVLWREE